MSARVRQILFAILFGVVGGGALFAGAVAGRHLTWHLPLVLGASAVAVVVAAIGAFTRAPAGDVAPGARPRRVVTGARELVSAYRGAVREAPPAVTPVSTRATILVVLACCAFTAAALPLALRPLPSHLAPWLQIEGVLAAWWAVWAVVLGVLAYRGRPLDEEHSLAVRSPLAWTERGPLFSSSDGDALRPEDAGSSSGKKPWWKSAVGFDVEGVLFLVVVLAVMTVAATAAWVVAELALPVVFYVTYLGVDVALRRALAARHRGRLAESALHGILWATAYVVPLGGAVAAAHAVLARG